MKILLLHQHFNTPEKGGPLRSFYIATELASRGHQVIVITAHNKSNHAVEIHDGFEVHYLPVAYGNDFGFYQRILSFLHFAMRTVGLSRRFRDASVCYAISTPLSVGLAAMALKKFYRIPYVFEVGDLWPEAPIQMGFIKNSFLKSSLYSMESKIYRDASSIVALSQPIKEYIGRREDRKRIHVVENMADTDFFQTSTTVSQKKVHGLENKFVISYIGAIGYANGLEFLLRCAEETQRVKLAVQYIICGAGATLVDLKKQVKHKDLKNISFLSFRSRAGVKEVIDITDATIISYRNEKILESGSPNKYFDGLAAGKLIVVNFGGWIREEIENNQCGIFVDPTNPEDFVAKIRRFIVDNELLKTCQENARKLAEKKYARRELVERAAAIIENAVKPTSVK